MKYFKKLVGERIYLSPRNVEDVEIFTEWMNDFYVTDYTGRSHTSITLQEEKEYFDNILKDIDANITLDEEQRRVCLDDEDYSLIIVDSIDNTKKGDDIFIKGQHSSSNKTILLESFDKYNFENKDTICFSPEDRFLNSIGAPPYFWISLHSILEGL